jgi:ribonuclease P protein component
MLPAANRLRRPGDIARAYQRGSYGAAQRLLSLKAARTGHAHTRAVVVVSKKVDKRAVVRNRIRRRLIEALRAQWGTVPGGYDIVISVHAHLDAQTPQQLAQLLTQALAAAGLNRQPH